jgi:PRC-barrel domain
MNRHMMIFAGASTVMASCLFTQVLAEETKGTGPIPFVTEQPANEWLARLYIDAPVQNTSGEKVGEVNDLVFDKAGHISTVVLGVGGFLGIGEKNVAVPFSALTYGGGNDGTRTIVVGLSKDALKQAPSFKATEKTTFDKMKDKAVDLGTKASDKAGELKDKAVKKVEDMKSGQPKKE